MVIQLEELKSYLENYERRVRPFIVNLEDDLIKGRDKLKKPIYLTEWRIKSPESTYMKI